MISSTCCLKMSNTSNQRKAALVPPKSKTTFGKGGSLTTRLPIPLAHLSYQEMCMIQQIAHSNANALNTKCWKELYDEILPPIYKMHGIVESPKAEEAQLVLLEHVNFHRGIRKNRP
jgi:hypothetical protein